MEIKIIYEDRDILIVDKPAGLLVHPVKDSNEPTLVDWLVKKYPDIKKVGESPERPGIVHRLDKNTSGLLIVAKNNKAYIYLKKQFKKRLVKKKYLALVIGKPKDKSGIIVKSISKSWKKKKQTVIPGKTFKEAITRYKVLKEFENYSLLEVVPETGRTHQIRVHLASIGHPVAGDEKYKFKRQPQIKDLKRHFLHANYLRFSLPSGKIKEFNSKLPEELNNILKKLT